MAGHSADPVRVKVHTLPGNGGTELLAVAGDRNLVYHASIERGRSASQAK